MSEKVFSWLLRLYPRRFRDRFGDEALQLFRDRLRDEPGLCLRLRLGLDLLADFALSLPRQHRRAEPAAAGVPTMFVLVDDRPLRPERFLAGAVLTLLAAFAMFSFAHAGRPRPADLLAHFMPGQVGSRFPHGPEPKMPVPEAAANDRGGHSSQNCTIEKAEVLPHNIAYLKANCLNVAAAALVPMNGVGAIIFDLRDTRSGSSGTVSFFSRFANKPSYILTSGSTMPLVSSPTGMATEPDFQLRSEDAFDTAQKLAQALLRQ